jgi:hypothetical protein
MASDTEGNGGVYLAMLWCGTIELVFFGALYFTYSWLVG